jgi:hypothetical protein
VRAVDLDATTRELMAPVCRGCIWWQSSTADDADSSSTEARDDLRAAWEREVLATAGLFGRMLIGDDGAVGWMHAAPDRLLPRLRDLPAGPPPGEAWLLTCAYFHDEEFLSGFQTLLHDLIAALKRRNVKVLEAYALRDPTGDDRFRGYLREANLFNAGVLKGSGFRRVASAGAVGRYRLELATLVAAPRRKAAQEKLSTRPATLPT